MKKRTLQVLYAKEKARPTPASSFVKSIAELTNRSETTVRKWLAGDSMPDHNVKVILSRHFAIPYDELFPEN